MDLDDLVKNIDRYIEMDAEIVKAVSKHAPKIADEETINTYKDYAKVEVKKYTEVFNRVVDAFYSDYTPLKYKRQGNININAGGLYDLLDIQTDETGRVLLQTSYKDILNPSNMHTDRHGGSLYETVFEQGWHGGARSIASDKTEVWGAHPSPGTAYWRTRGKVKYPGATKYKMHRYGRWYRTPAARMRPSPSELLVDWLEDADRNELYQELKTISGEYAKVIGKRIQDEIIEPITKKYML